MGLPLESGWRHLRFENRSVGSALMDSRPPDARSALAHARSAWLSVVPARLDSPGRDVVAEPGNCPPVENGV